MKRAFSAAVFVLGWAASAQAQLSPPAVDPGFQAFLAQSHADALMEKQGVEPAPAADRHLGTWTGTWDGAGSGGFELTFEKDAAGSITGRVSVTGDPTYKASLSTVSFEGGKMSARYDFPPDERAEVVLAGSFEGETATGSWSLLEKGTGNEVASGGWKVTRK